MPGQGSPEGNPVSQESRPDAGSSTLSFAIAIGRFYEELAERLEAGARAAFTEAGHTDVEVFDVPGAFELPLAASYAASSGRFAGVACLGAVIRGETSHYDYVCAEAARGIQQVQLSTGVPCAFGVLTCETMEQALARAGGDKRDQGRHAAQVVMRMAELRRELSAVSFKVSDEDLIKPIDVGWDAASE